jgi:RNA polymerase sigma-70 factor (ECF subfamily)
VDDRALVDAVRAGDREAFRVLVEREHRTVFRACYRILGMASDAEDATQEAFVIAFRSLGTYRGEGSLGAWLARIGTRQALRRLSQRREATPLETVEASLVAGPDPLGIALTAERERQVRAAVTALDEPYRETVALRFFAELSLNEIADATGRPLGTVKTHLHRGLARLRDRLGSEMAA